MPTGRQRVSPTEQTAARQHSNLDWDGARVFLEVARHGSLRAAAKSLHLTVNILRRRLSRLEHSLGMMLVTRHIDGVRLTPEGHRLLVTAQQMETAAFEFVRGQGIGDSSGAGRTKLAVTEGLATYWVMPQLVGYLAANPDLSVELNCTMVPVDVLRLEADISIQLVRPSAKDLKLVKLGRLLAVEGKLENFMVLRRNLAAIAQAVAVHALIAPGGRGYAAHTPPGNTGGTYFLPSDAGGVATPCVTLDALCRDHFTPRVVKIDIEGGEAFALSDTRLLRAERPIVYAEVNSRMLQLQGASIGGLESLFRGAGYRLFRNIGDRHAAHDDFVVAELETLPTNLNNFDVLAVHNADDRLASVLR